MFLELIVNHGEPAPRLCNKDSLTLHFAVLLSQLFPNAKFLWVVRDPRATVHSIISRQARCLFIIFCIKPQVLVQSQALLVPNWKRFRQNYVVQTPRRIVKLWALCKPFIDVIRNMNSNVSTVNDSKLLVYNTITICFFPRIFISETFELTSPQGFFLLILQMVYTVSGLWSCLR